MSWAGAEVSWAGALTSMKYSNRNFSTFKQVKNAKRVNCDGPTDGKTDGRTDTVTYRSRCPRQKKKEKKKQVEQSSDNRCVLWRTARVLVFELYFKWHTFLFLMLFCSNLAYFTEIELVCDGRTDRRTDGRTYPLKEMRERI